ncbi:hypothetical protein [Paraburkholderia sp. DHOC27]|uniref:hypothetical protein n=1 Tax=Paraburkholderia sp. DHOC27 TaxID=2303330 RepID=UPI000E3E83CF|nr:hypothetical protein [Paraburkholderia sp. DHOC27]RFU49534.1 hypothetical protein D0B32_07030 [Paraburkholderia sp. DHOC27]
MFMKWLLVNIWIAALAPAIWAFVIWLVERMRDHRAQSHILSAYVDGQLGFVAIGWCASALLEMDTYEECVMRVVSWGGLTGLLWFTLFLSGLVAAAGARWPVASRASVSQGVSLLWRYLAAWFTLALGMVSLGILIYVHLFVTTSKDPKCSLSVLL